MIEDQIATLRPYNARPARRCTQDSASRRGRESRPGCRPPRMGARIEQVQAVPSDVPGPVVLPPPNRGRNRLREWQPQTSACSALQTRLVTSFAARTEDRSLTCRFPAAVGRIRALRNIGCGGRRGIALSVSLAGTQPGCWRAERAFGRALADPNAHSAQWPGAISPDKSRHTKTARFRNSQVRTVVGSGFPVRTNLSQAGDRPDLGQISAYLVPHQTGLPAEGRSA
jgi:hypothetical protein